MSGTNQRQPRRAVLVPLALAQFLCSYAGCSMNVMINDISTDPEHHCHLTLIPDVRPSEALPGRPCTFKCS